MASTRVCDANGRVVGVVLSAVGGRVLLLLLLQWTRTGLLVVLVVLCGLACLLGQVRFEPTDQTRRPGELEYRTCHFSTPYVQRKTRIPYVSFLNHEEICNVEYPVIVSTSAAFG